MIDPTDLELRAMDAAGGYAGEYLESIGKSDLAALTLDEWRTFLQVVCGNYVKTLGDLTLEGEVPF